MVKDWIDRFSYLLSMRVEIKWVVSFILAIFLSALVKFCLNLVHQRWLQITKNNPSVLIQAVGNSVGQFKKIVIFIWIFDLLISSIHPQNEFLHFFHMAVVLATSYQIFVWGMDLLRLWKSHFLEVSQNNGNGASQSAIGLIYIGTQTLFISLLILLSLSNMGVNVGALLAGLGVGGIAVALAAQNILGDLLASLSIVFDKPFVIGDYIVVGNEKGTVENIGIKTTRVRSLSGEELIFSNKDLLESRIQNYKRMVERRVLHRIGVTYSTSLEQLKVIPQWIQDIITSQNQVRFERCHLAQCGNFSLDFEVVYWILNSDYNIFMDIQQQNLLSIINKFRDEGIEFAFPTQTLVIDNLPKK